MGMHMVPWGKRLGVILESTAIFPAMGYEEQKEEVG